MSISPFRQIRRKLFSDIYDLIVGTGAYEKFKLKKRYYKNFKQNLDPHNLSTFNAHLTHRLLNKRDPLISQTTDKVAVRDYVTKKIGSQYLAKHHLVIENLDQLEKGFDDLPSAFVLKPSHASKHVKVVRNKDDVSLSEIKKLCKNWLMIDYSLASGEWMYRDIPRRVIFEELLLDQDGDIPMDYKFFVFHNEMKFLHIDIGRFEEHSRSLYTRDWDKLPIEFNCPIGPDLKKPDNLDKMIELSETLSEDFDFVRVDFYDLGDRIVFGELTHSPAAGGLRIKPEEYDQKFALYFQGLDPLHQD